MKKCICILGAVSLLALGAGFNLWAQESVQVTNEDLLFMEISMVVSSSKREQPLAEAASSVKVVTFDDIKNSGATNLADVLRSVAGIDVREAHAGQHVIGIRGFSDTSHVLVTIDGNNVFMYHANHIFLDWAPIDLGTSTGASDMNLGKYQGRSKDGCDLSIQMTGLVLKML